MSGKVRFSSRGSPKVLAAGALQSHAVCAVQLIAAELVAPTGDAVSLGVNMLQACATDGIGDNASETSMGGLRQSQRSPNGGYQRGDTGPGST